MESLALAKNEESRLCELESIIQRNLNSFYEIGMALMEVRDNRLYRAEYDTFEQYCRERWQFGKRVAYQYIESVKVIENVRHGAQTNIEPVNERQTRPLAKLPAKEQREVWQEAVETAPDGKVTAKHVESVVAKTLNKERPPAEESYSSGLVYVEFAISQMERIHPKDTQKQAAWARMRQWLNDNE